MWHWLALLAGGLLEIGWAVSLHASDGLRRPLPAMITLLLLAGSMGLLAVAMQRIPLGTAYAVWTGIGAAGTAVYGMVVLGEPRDLPRIACLALIVLGIVGLRALGGAPTPQE